MSEVNTKVSNANSTVTALSVTTLVENIDANTHTINVSDSMGFRTGCILKIDDEYICVGEISANSFNSCIRCAGAIKFYTENSMTGEFDLVHSVSYANQNIKPSIYNANLLFHMESTNNGNIFDIVLQSASAGLFVEGKI